MLCFAYFNLFETKRLCCFSAFQSLLLFFKDIFLCLLSILLDSDSSLYHSILILAIIGALNIYFWLVVVCK
jgi:hypothetical protein